MEEIELERTFLAKEIPKDLTNFKSKKIIDMYFPKDDSYRMLRLRQSGENFMLTKKGPKSEDKTIQSEQTINLTEEEFNEFLVIDSLRVEKTRYYYEHDGHKYDIDVFGDKLKGLVLIDIEFESVEDMKNFTAPEFCLVDVSQEKFIKGGTLAGQSYEEIETDLDKYNYKKII